MGPKDRPDDSFIFYYVLHLMEFHLPQGIEFDIAAENDIMWFSIWILTR
jgi:hypothetical protein